MHLITEGSISACEEFMNNPELLSNVFIHCMSDGITTPSFARAPLQLIFVCKQWKRVAERTSQLWCRFKLILSEEEGLVGICKCCRVLARFLRCSGNKQLDAVLMYPYEEVPDYIRSSLRFLYKIFCAGQDRWSNVSLRLPLDTFSPDSGQCFVTSRKLERLYLDTSSTSFRHNGEPFLEITPSLVRCPSLKHLIVIGRRMQELEKLIGPQVLSLECSPTLQTLELRNTLICESDYANDFKPWGTTNVWKLVLVDVEVFLHCGIYEGFYVIFPSLTWLEIRHPHDFDIFEASCKEVGPIVLENLRHLGLLLRKWDFLNCFRTPNLVTLDIEEGRVKLPEPEGEAHNCKGCVPLSSALLVDFIDRNNITLRAFHLSAVTFDEWELIKSLTNMPYLRELRVNFQDTSVSDQLLVALSERYALTYGRESWYFCFICPFLTIFTLTVGAGRHDLSTGAIVDLVSSRSIGWDDEKNKFTASIWEELALPISAEFSALFKETHNMNLTSTLTDE